MLDQNETPTSQRNKLNSLTKYLPQQKAEMLLLLLAKTNQNNANENRMKPKREPGINAFPLSYNQEEFWLLNKLQPDCLALNLCSSYEISGPLNVDALEKAIHDIVKRHENLRTTFKEVAGTPMQFISPVSPFQLPVIDMQGLGQSDHMVEVKRLLHAKTYTPFDLENGPLFKICLIKLDDETHVIWWCMHHILVDGIGLTLFIKELKELYAYYAFNRKHQLAEIDMQCTDYALWQREHYGANRLDPKIAYWQNQLLGYQPKRSLPADYKRPKIQTYNGAEQLFSIPKRTDAKLKRLSGEIGISIFMILFSGFYLLTYTLTGQLDNVIGSPISHRNRDTFKEMISDFSNMLLYRTILSEQDRVSDVLQKVKQTALGAYQHQEVPSQMLFHVLKPEIDAAYSPLFQMMFVFHQLFPQEQDQFLEGTNTKYLNIETTSSQFDISLFMFDDDQEGLYGKFEYNTDLYAHHSILKFIEHLQVLFAIIAELPELKITELKTILDERMNVNDDSISQ